LARGRGVTPTNSNHRSGGCSANAVPARHSTGEGTPSVPRLKPPRVIPGELDPFAGHGPKRNECSTGARKCKPKPKGDQAPEPRRGDSADASAKLQSPLRCSHQGPGALIFARILGLALKDAGFRLFPRSAGIESGDISPHPTILPVLEQAAFLLAPALEEGGLWSAAKRRRFGFPAKRGDRPKAPFSTVRPQDASKDEGESLCSEV